MRSDCGPARFRCRGQVGIVHQPGRSPEFGDETVSFRVEALGAGVIVMGGSSSAVN